MKISLQNYNSNVTFGTMRMDDEVTRKPIDSDFFRDFETQNFVAQELKKRFKGEQDILVYANSSGEDSFSISLLLDNPKFKILGFDISKTAYDKYLSGIYHLDKEGFDSFLMQGEKKKLTDKMLTIKEGFDKYFKYVGQDERGREMRQYDGGLRDRVFYMPPYYGDIRNIGGVPRENQAASVFFRNSFFHLMPEDKNISYFLRDMVRFPNDFRYFLDKNTLTQGEYLEFTQGVKNVLAGVRQKLAPGGLFVMGNIMQEHYFLAPRGFKGETVPFLYTDLGKAARDELLKINSDRCERALEMLHYVNVVKNSPIADELERSFKPIYKSGIQNLDSVKIPTVWEKI